MPFHALAWVQGSGASAQKGWVEGRPRGMKQRVVIAIALACRSAKKHIPGLEGFHFHMMWFDKRENTFRHFTHYKLNGWFTTLWFKGTVEEVKRKHLEKWCRDKGVKIKV